MRIGWVKERRTEPDEQDYSALGVGPAPDAAKFLSNFKLQSVKFRILVYRQDVGTSQSYLDIHGEVCIRFKPKK